jgi:hypothetical protein
MDTALLGEAEGLTPSGKTAERSLEGGQPPGQRRGILQPQPKTDPSNLIIGTYLAHDFNAPA